MAENLRITKLQVRQVDNNTQTTIASDVPIVVDYDKVYVDYGNTADPLTLKDALYKRTSTVEGAEPGYFNVAGDSLAQGIYNNSVAIEQILANEDAPVAISNDYILGLFASGS